jgi:peptidoglycan/LPS O-acetylase OafA/YrhL
MSDLRSPRSDNNFGLLRLLLALLVIVSHSPQLVDGNASREIMFRLFGTMTLGSAAVDGFFIVSGYLITKSFVQSPSVAAYVAKRFVRIAPAVGGVDPLSSAATTKHLLLLMLRLLPPAVPGTFLGNPYTDLNLSMWTIAYECRCYIAAAIIGLLGLYDGRFRLVFVFGTVALLIADSIGVANHPVGAGESLTGSFDQDIRFAASFAAGACFYLCRDEIRFTAFGAGLSAVCLAVLLFSARWAEAGLIVCGGYLMFWFVFELRIDGFSRIGRGIDISYGLYLYAWTVQNILIWMDRAIDPLLLTALTIPVAAAFGYASWIWVERPAMRLLASRIAARAGPLGARQSAGHSHIA